MLYLEHIMREQGITQAELSRRTGVAASTISDVCNKRRFPTYEQHQKFCEVLGWAIKDEPDGVKESIERGTRLFTRNSELISLESALYKTYANEEEAAKHYAKYYPICKGSKMVEGNEAAFCEFFYAIEEAMGTLEYIKSLLEGATFVGYDGKEVRYFVFPEMECCTSYADDLSMWLEAVEVEAQKLLTLKREAEPEQQQA